MTFPNHDHTSVNNLHNPNYFHKDVEKHNQLEHHRIVDTSLVASKVSRTPKVFGQMPELKPIKPTVLPLVEDSEDKESNQEIVHLDNQPKLKNVSTVFIQIEAGLE